MNITGGPGRAVFPCQSVMLIAVMQTITPTDLPGHEDAKGYSHEKVSIHCKNEAIIWKNKKNKQKRKSQKLFSGDPPTPKSLEILFFGFLWVFHFCLVDSFFAAGFPDLLPRSRFRSKSHGKLRSALWATNMLQNRLDTMLCNFSLCAFHVYLNSLSLTSSLLTRSR